MNPRVPAWRVFPRGNPRPRSDLSGLALALGWLDLQRWLVRDAVWISEQLGDAVEGVHAYPRSDACSDVARPCLPPRRAGSTGEGER